MPPVALLVEELVQNLTHELSEDLYLQVGPEDKALFVDPWGWFGKDALSVFPEAQRDAVGCARCLVAEQWTASVYHAMIIFQCGLHWLAHELSLAFPNSIDVENWNTIIERIESAIRDLSQTPKTAERDAQLAFYSQMASHVFYVKEAWRNFVSHGRSHYSKDDARAISDNVRGFMAKIAKSVLPPPTPTPCPPL